MPRGKPQWQYDHPTISTYRFTDEERQALFDNLVRHGWRAREFADALQRLTADYHRRDIAKNQPSPAALIVAADDLQTLSLKLAKLLASFTLGGLDNWLFPSQRAQMPDPEELREQLQQLELVCKDAKKSIQQIKRPGVPPD